MTTALPILSERFIIELFTPTTLLRGREYYVQRKVSDITMVAGEDGGWLVTALVKGSQRKPYLVKLDYYTDRNHKWHVETECTCPVEFNCKHAAATLVSINVSAAKTSPQPINDDGALALDQWLLTLQHRQKAAASQRYTFEPAAGELHVVLVPGNGITVELYHCPFKRNGELGKGRREPVPRSYDRYSRAIWLSDDLLPFFVRLRNYMDQYDDVLRGENGAKALEMLVTQLPCHWQSIDNPRLRLGDPLAASPQWVIDTDGRSRLQLHTAKQLLRVAPPYVIDDNFCIVQRLDMPIDPVLLESLCDAPAVAGKALIKLADTLQIAAPLLPLPPALPAVRSDVPVTAIMRFSTKQLTRQQLYPTLAPESQLHYVEMFFEYAGHQIPSTLPDPVLHLKIDGQLTSVRRDRINEQRFLAVVPPLHPLHVLLPYSLKPLVPETAFSPPYFGFWITFVSDYLPRLRAAGWQIENAETLNITVSDSTDLTAHIEQNERHDWFELSLDFDAGGERINILPLLQKHAKTLEKNTEESLILPDPTRDGHFIRIESARAHQILTTLTELFDDTLHSDKLRIPNTAILRIEELPVREWHGGQRLREWVEKLRGGITIKEVAPPAEFNAQLRPYQQQGLNWLQGLREYQLHGLLADDMGLGKTVQTLAHISVEKHSGRLAIPCLIVCPTSLVANWKHEAARFAPQLRVHIHHGADRDVTAKRFAQFDLLVTSYPVLQRDIAFIAKQNWHLLVLDEAQQIKNVKSLAAHAVRQLRASHRLALTGTPMENHLGELWSLMDFLMPSLLSDEKQFRRLFRKPIEEEGDNARRQTLVRRIAPLMLRRTKQEVVKELPEKQEIIRTLTLEPKQRDLYETVRVAMQEKVKQEIAKKGFNRSHIVMLDALLKLRQVCCDPQLVKLPSAKSVKQSAKMNYLFELMEELLPEGRRILLFSQFTEMLNLIEAQVVKLKIAYVRLDGQTNDRETPVQRFQRGEVPLFLISLKAGGVGLNLTAADTVIHYDPWWNPAVENQATDRAHRIGQDKKVFVYKLISEGTVEEKIHALQQRKQALADGIYNDKQNAEISFSADDMAYLLQPLDE